MNATKIAAISFCVLTVLPTLLEAASPVPKDSRQLTAASADTTADQGSVLGSPSTGKALVYVYRKHDKEGKFHGLIFANGDLLATGLIEYSYARLEAPQGTVEITSTGPSYASGAYHPSFLRTSGSGCGGLDWWHLVEAQREAVARCENELAGALKVLPTSATSPVSGLCGFRSDSNVYQLYAGLNSESCRNAINWDLGLIDFASSGQFRVDGFNQAKSRLRFDAEVGKTYYVRWSFTYLSGGKLALVDAKTGAKEMTGLHRDTSGLP